MNEKIRTIRGRMPSEHRYGVFKCRYCGQCIKPGAKADLGVKWDGREPEPHAELFHPQCLALAGDAVRHGDKLISDNAFVEFWCRLAVLKNENETLPQRTRDRWLMFGFIVGAFYHEEPWEVLKNV